MKMSYCQALKVRAESINNKHALIIENAGSEGIFEVKILVRCNDDLLSTIDFDLIPEIPAGGTRITSDKAGNLIRLHPAVVSGPVVLLLLKFSYDDGQRDSCVIQLSEIKWHAP